MREILPYLGVVCEYDEGEAEFAEVSLPDVTGQLVDEAMIQMNKAGDFDCEVIGSGTTVTAQYPMAGQKLVRGSSVILYTDAGAQQQVVTVPNLLNLTNSQVQETLAGLQLNLSAIGSVKDEANVLSITQDIAEGTSLPIGSVVQVEFEDKSLRD